MTRRVHTCSRCSCQGYTRADCPECRGFGEYWAERPYYGGFRPIDSYGAVEDPDLGEAQRLYEAGLGLKSIGKRLGRCPSTISALLKGAGVPVRAVGSRG